MAHVRCAFKKRREVGMVTGLRRASPARRGLDPWRTADGIPFSTWDHWFLLLIYGERGGAWSALRVRLRDRRRGMGFAQSDAEAKLSHLDDLEKRWESLRESSREALRGECFDRQLVRRARVKILEQYVDDRDKTTAMRETPRARLRERALRGYWTRFPVSPASFDQALRAELERRDFYGERATFGLARRLDASFARHLTRAARPAEHVAVIRAFLTGLLLAMERADDSCGVLSDLARDHFPKYFTAPWREAGLSADVYYRDFIEYAVWEDYGLLGLQELAPFFEKISKAEVTLVDRVLRELWAELCSAELDYQAEEALTLLSALHVNQRSFELFEALAQQMGSRHWQRITTMAEAALTAGKRDLARAVFAAADQPVDSVARTQRMAQEQRPRVSRDVRNHFNDRESRHVALESLQCPVAARSRECAFPRPTNDPGRDLDLRQPARRHDSGSEQPADHDAPGFPHVPLDQRARVEVTRHARSSRSATMASDTSRPPRARIGRNGASGRRSARVTAPSACRRSSFVSSSVGPCSGFSSATGCPRSVMTSVRPWRTCCRYAPSRVFSSRAPTVAHRAM
jgi:hypothetical protein